MKRRYACDYLQSVFPRKITLPYFKRLAEQQDYSGRLSDASVAGLGHDGPMPLSARAIYQHVARQNLGVFDFAPSRRKDIVDDWLPLLRLIEAPD